MTPCNLLSTTYLQWLQSRIENLHPPKNSHICPNRRKMQSKQLYCLLEIFYKSWITGSGIWLVFKQHAASIFNIRFLHMLCCVLHLVSKKCLSQFVIQHFGCILPIVYICLFDNTVGAFPPVSQTMT